MSKKSDKEVIKDEADAEDREVAREGAIQAAVERRRAVDAAYLAHAQAEQEATAEAAKNTFWQKMKERLKEFFDA
jgi:6-pyruvoyl-tetrahydropterin synthase